MVALRADVGIGVGVTTGQFDVRTFFAHQPGKFFGQDGRALVVVGDDLGNCHAFFADLAIHEEGRNTGIFGFLYSRHSWRQRLRCRG